jgi:DNA-binding FadR family transcriptional regulator
LDHWTTGGDAKRVLYAHAIMELIAAERLEVEYRFPARVRLARTWGVGANTVNEAINLAVDAGFVGVTHGDRTEVLPREEWDVMHPLVVNRAHRSSPRPETFLAEYLEAETVLEVGTIQLLETPGADLIAGLEATLGQMRLAAMGSRRTDLPPDYRHADSHFHALLASATGNVVTARQSGLLRKALTLEALIRVSSPKDIAQELAEHRAILAALTRGDVMAAAQELRRHLTAMTDRMARSERLPAYPSIDEPGFVLQGWRP